jgi:hypothetical protein
MHQWYCLEAFEPPSEPLKFLGTRPPCNRVQVLAQSPRRKKRFDSPVSKRLACPAVRSDLRHSATRCASGAPAVVCIAQPYLAFQTQHPFEVLAFTEVTPSAV